jgi:hypothetical protein
VRTDRRSAKMLAAALLMPSLILAALVAGAALIFVLA